MGTLKKFSKTELNRYAKNLGLKKVHFIGDIPKKKDSTASLEKLRVYKYMEYRHAKDMILSKIPKLYFVSPANWEDPMEKRFVEGNYKNAVKFTQETLACTCVTTNASDNEAASWIIYNRKGDKQLVRLTLSFGELMKELDAFVSGKDASVYVAGVNYVPVNEIESPVGVPSAKDFTANDFLKLMLLKRKSYMFEGEVRIMIYGNGVKLENKKSCLIPITGDIRRVVLTVRVSPEENETSLKKENVLFDIGNRVTVNQSRMKKVVHKFTLKK